MGRGRGRVLGSGDLGHTGWVVRLRGKREHPLPWERRRKNSVFKACFVGMRSP